MHPPTGILDQPPYPRDGRVDVGKWVLPPPHVGPGEILTEHNVKISITVYVKEGSSGFGCQETGFNRYERPTRASTQVPHDRVAPPTRPDDKVILTVVVQVAD